MNDLLVQAFKKPNWSDYYDFCMKNDIGHTIVGVETYKNCHRQVNKGELTLDNVFIAKG